MMFRKSRHLIVAFGLFAMSGPVLAQVDPILESARAQGQVGEQADGYLGIRGSASGELKAHVDQLNIKRKAVYTETAVKRGVTVADVGAATGCELFASRVAPGEYYRDANGVWHQRVGNAAVPLPPYCGR
ncbi:MAG: YdbL family protein [Sphingomonadaceae bacterium]